MNINSSFSTVINGLKVKGKHSLAKKVQEKMKKLMADVIKTAGFKFTRIWIDSHHGPSLAINFKDELHYVGGANSRDMEVVVQGNDLYIDTHVPNQDIRSCELHELGKGDILRAEIFERGSDQYGEKVEIYSCTREMTFQGEDYTEEIANMDTKEFIDYAENYMF